MSELALLLSGECWSDWASMDSTDCWLMEDCDTDSISEVDCVYCSWRLEDWRLVELFESSVESSTVKLTSRED